MESLRTLGTPAGRGGGIKMHGYANRETENNRISTGLKKKQTLKTILMSTQHMVDPLSELHARLKCCLLEEMNNNKNNHSICLNAKASKTSPEG